MVNVPQSPGSSWQCVAAVERSTLTGLLEAARALSGAEAAWLEDEQVNRWPESTTEAIGLRTLLPGPASTGSTHGPALFVVLAGAVSASASLGLERHLPVSACERTRTNVA